MDFVEKRAIENEINGFAGWIATIVIYALYLMWAYLPDSMLESYGITYYPSKYWAIALPSVGCVLVFLSSIVYRGINLLSIAPLTSYSNIADRHTRELTQEILEQDAAETPDIADIPLAAISKSWIQKS